MARNQTFQSRQPQAQQGASGYGRDRESRGEGEWRSQNTRDDYFSAMAREGSGGEPSWDEDRYGYPEATSYGREMSRGRSGYAPEGRFAYDPYEQQQRNFEFGRGAAWPRDQGGRGGRDWSSAQYGAGQYQRDFQGDFSQDFSGRVQNPGSRGSGRDAWRGQPQTNWGEEFTPYSGWRNPSFGGAGQGQDFSQPRKTPKGYTRSDERIRDDVCEQLYRSHDVDVGNVSVEVRSGTVTLEGTVPERQMKHRIEDLCEHCIGVSDVENRIRVSRGETQQGAGTGESEDGERSGRKSGVARH
jgi:hypothetical protein